MIQKSKRVKDWRKRTKQRIVDAFGGGCGVCGYNRCHEALVLHHLNPAEKEVGLSSLRASIRSWEYIVDELRKCAMLCMNCHAEVHAGVLELPHTVPRFNENYAEYREVQQLDPCPICGGSKPRRNITCSPACAARKARKVDWSSIDLIDMKRAGMSNTSIGDMLGVSEMSVRKRLKKLGYTR